MRPGFSRCGLRLLCPEEALGVATSPDLQARKLEIGTARRRGRHASKPPWLVGEATAACSARLQALRNEQPKGVSEAAAKTYPVWEAETRLVKVLDGVGARVGRTERRGGEVSTVQRDLQSTEKSAYHEVSVGRDARAKDFEVWREPKKEAVLRAEKTIARLPTNIGVTAEDSAALILDDRQRGPAVALHGVAEAVEREAVLGAGVNAEPRAMYRRSMQREPHYFGPRSLRERRQDGRLFRRMGQYDRWRPCVRGK
mmetsp:Transcript_4867/g.10510  ORF Transcript_4867/g.10510 Transcript_4867/m.10510 type:complete len:256 (+) Transcript_4867:226-993(+)